MFVVTILDATVKAFDTEEKALAYRDQLEDLIKFWPRIAWKTQSPPVPIVKWIAVE